MSRIKDKNVPIGEYKNRIRKIWCGMIERCYKPYKQHWRYKAGGIKVCDEWRNNYLAFKEWALLNGYSDDLTIDRFPNPKGDYEPTNCRWATPKEQSNNRKTNRFLEMNGEKKTIAEWSDVTGVPQILIKQRIDVLGWSEKDAIITQPNVGISERRISKNNKRRLLNGS